MPSRLNHVKDTDTIQLALQSYLKSSKNETSNTKTLNFVQCSYSLCCNHPSIYLKTVKPLRIYHYRTSFLKMYPKPQRTHPSATEGVEQSQDPQEYESISMNSRWY